MSANFIRSNIRSMHGYTPGEQPAIGEKVVKLNTNENPFPPSPKVMQAIRDVPAEALRRYPNPTADGFRDVAAKVFGVTRDNIIAGNGSDDILTIVTRTFIPPGGLLAYPEPTYSLYNVLAGIEDAKIAPVPWKAGWSLPIDQLVATKANAIYLANPNAPSGTFVPPSEVAKLVEEFPGAVLIDEAYADFAVDNCIGLVKKYPNAIVSRTFSKAYSLAGMRFGFAVAQPQVIEEMMKVKDSYNCDAISIAAATAAMSDQDYAKMTWDHVKKDRKRVTSELEKLGFKVLPSQTNFVFAEVPGGDGLGLYQKLKAKSVLVRHFNYPSLKQYLRITIGTTEENDLMLRAIQSSGVSE